MRIEFEKKYTQQEIEDGNTIPYFGVTWDNPRLPGTGKRVGNGWTRKEKAESVFREKEKLGLNPTATESRIGGFV